MAFKEPKEKNLKKKSNLETWTNYLSFVPFVSNVRRKKKITEMVNKINQSNSDLNKKISKRRELILELIDSTKQDIHWDRNILIQITKLRNINLNSLTMKQKIEFSQKLDQLSQSIENHINSNLKWKNIIDNHHLPDKIQKTENEIAISGEKYNTHVTNFNQTLQNRRMNLIANRMGLTNHDLFELDTPLSLNSNSEGKIDFD